MSDAIARMAIYLAQAEPWVPDRHINTGPNFANQRPTVTHTIVERDPGLKARVLSALQRGGPQTSEVIAKKLRLPQREVGAKLSRLYRDGHVERALSATSPHTGRAVLLYWVRDHG